MNIIKEFFKTDEVKQKERVKLEAQILEHIIDNSEYEEKGDKIIRAVKYNEKIYTSEKSKEELELAKKLKTVFLLIKTDNENLMKKILTDLDNK